MQINHYLLIQLRNYSWRQVWLSQLFLPEKCFPFSTGIARALTRWRVTPQSLHSTNSHAKGITKPRRGSRSVALYPSVNSIAAFMQTIAYKNVKITTSHTKATSGAEKYFESILNPAAITTFYAGKETEVIYPHYTLKSAKDSKTKLKRPHSSIVTVPAASFPKDLAHRHLSLNTPMLFVLPLVYPRITSFGAISELGCSHRPLTRTRAAQALAQFQHTPQQELDSVLRGPFQLQIC